MNILVTGANGQLGSEIRKRATAYPQWNFFFFDLPELNLLKPDTLEGTIRRNQISCVINCAAYTSVDEAERHPAHAYEVNAYALKNLARCVNQYQLKLIHISTNLVFDGLSGKPYQETDPAHPVNQYGKSKLAGERIIRVICPNALIIRTSWLYSSFPRNCVHTIWALARMKACLRIVSDLLDSPTWAGDLANTILLMLDDPQTGVTKTGIYHYANEGIVSYYDFAREIVRLSGMDCPIEHLSSGDYLTPAPRPAFSALNTLKIRTDYGLNIPHWKKSLKLCFEEVVALEEKYILI